jgi:beta-lactamase superfamily II metal-dependent hydrolase
MLQRRGIGCVELLAITNYDEDHVSGLADLRNKMRIISLLRNKSVTSDTIYHLKAEDGMGGGIENLHEMIDIYTASGTPENPEPVFQGVEKRVFYNNYPAFDDENNLSMVLFIKCYGVGVMFTGDLEVSGWRALLNSSPDLKQALAETNVFIAPHHGRENGCCDEVFEHCKPYFVVISDCGYKFDTQLTVPWYRHRVIGGMFRDETRHVLTTRRDGLIGFQFNPDGSWSAV